MQNVLPLLTFDKINKGEGLGICVSPSEKVQRSDDRISAFKDIFFGRFNPINRKDFIFARIDIWTLHVTHCGINVNKKLLLISGSSYLNNWREFGMLLKGWRNNALRRVPKAIPRALSYMAYGTPLVQKSTTCEFTIGMIQVIGLLPPGFKGFSNKASLYEAHPPVMISMRMLKSKSE
jgi:hypothetical protein